MPFGFPAQSPARRPLPTFLLCLTIALAAHSVAAASDRRCEIDRLDGPDARVWFEGSWTAAERGPIPSGEVKVETGADTRLGIACSDGIRVTLAPETELNLEALAGPDAGPGRAILQLIEGLVGLVAPEAGPRGIDVRTPLAIASVRSTEWAVSHEPGASAVFVRAGRVSVRSEAGRATLGPGEGIDVKTAEGTSPVRRWGAARVAALGERLGPGWE